MNFKVTFNKIKFDLKRHYEDERDETSYLTIVLNVKVSDNCIRAKILDDTFNYANLDIVLMPQIKGKRYELIENIATDIKDIVFKMKYVDGLDVSISKHNITDNISEVTMFYSFSIHNHESHIYDSYRHL